MSIAAQNMTALVQRYRWIQTRNGCRTQLETLTTFKNAYRLAQPEGPLTHWHVKMFMPSQTEVHSDSTPVLISYADRRDAAGDLVANYIQWVPIGDELIPKRLPVPREHEGHY